ncbi:MAG TPA: hypothetical protein VK395_04000 [Gemmataceae bacterium]|nr:hypothetical protein [Gemmataceae bacterium]
MAKRVALVSCVKQKCGAAAPARDLYVSQLFRGLRRYAESHADTWYILSAEYGVLRPDQVVEPYERTLNTMPKRDRLAWAEKVEQQLLGILPAGAEVILLAGQRYREDIEPFLRKSGYSVSVPLQGLQIGKQLQRLKQVSKRRERRTAVRNAGLEGTLDRQAITSLLIEHGQLVFNGPHEFVQLAQIREADELLNDLQAHPHAYVLACVMDRQIKAEKAWVIPFRFAQKLGTFAFSRLAELTLDEVRDLMTKPEPLHRYTEGMSKNFHAAVGLIKEKYNGNAAKIWDGKPSSADVVYRFLEFQGVGPKIATMAANILARDFKVPFKDYYSIDVSADVHVQRVFGRLGLTDPEDSIEAVIYRARALHPEFPGLFDYPAWEIGRNWCRPHSPLCGDCYMKELCPSCAGSSG